MKKIRLNVDELEVQSYDTGGVSGSGTIHGQVITGIYKTACSIDCSYCVTCLQCDESDLGTCPGQYTCGYQTDFTCPGDCASDWETCPQTCDYPCA